MLRRGVFTMVYLAIASCAAALEHMRRRAQRRSFAHRFNCATARYFA